MVNHYIYYLTASQIYPYLVSKGLIIILQTTRFKHKQSELLAEIDSYFRQEDNEDKLETKEKLQTSLQREISEMIEQMASLAIAKDTVDKRYAFILLLIFIGAPVHVSEGYSKL